MNPPLTRLDLIGLIVFAILVAVCIVGLVVPTTAPAAPMSPRRCTHLPTDTVAWGISVHELGGKLYLCYQQGAAQGVTEIVCTPMGDCEQ